MTSPMDPTPPDESIITPAIRADAARLFGERAAGAMTGRDEEDLSVWLNQDSRHAQAYAEMERIWTAIDASTMPPAPAADGPAPLPKIRPSTTGGIRAVKQKPASTHHRRGRRSLGRTALAACLLMAVFAQSGTVFTRLRADAVTGVGEQRNVTLPDGSQAFLNTDSAIAIDYDAGRQVRLLRGEAAFTVAPAAGKPFVVAVGDGTVTALGTRFIVRMASEETSVAVTEHSVRVHQPNLGDRLIREGEEVDFGPHGIGTPERVSVTEADAWTRGVIRVVNRPLGEVVREIGRYHPGYITVMGSALAARPVNGVFRINDPVHAIDAMEKTLGVHSTRLGSAVIVLHD